MLDFNFLLVIGGEGWDQEEGKPAQLLKSGDVIVTHDGVKHCHGATKDSWFVHIAITAGRQERKGSRCTQNYRILGKKDGRIESDDIKKMITSYLSSIRG